MKFLSLFSLFVAASAVNVPFTSCGKNSDVVTIGTIDISPAPAPGITIAITATGTASAIVADGTFSLEADYGFLPVVKQTGDICSDSAPVKIACPSPVGAQTVHGSFAIPSIAPKGGYKIKISANTKAGAELFCANISFNMASEVVDESELGPQGKCDMNKVPTGCPNGWPCIGNKCYPRAEDADAIILNSLYLR